MKIRICRLFETKRTIQKLTLKDVTIVCRQLCMKHPTDPKAIYIELLAIRKDQEKEGLLDSEVKERLDFRISILRDMIAPPLPPKNPHQ